MHFYLLRIPILNNWLGRGGGGGGGGGGLA